MDYSAQFRSCLETLDVVGIRRLWAHVSPHLPAPASDAEALVTLHAARTMAESIPFKMRAYSHRWLTDNGYSSQLPDHLKPAAEREYPKIASAVGVSVNSSMEEMRPVAKFIESEISAAIAESYEDGVVDPELVRSRMKEARDGAVRYAFGRFSSRPPITAGIIIE